MPMPPDSGSDVTLIQNPETGLFDLDFDETNNFAFDDTETHTVLSLLLERLAEYWADVTGKRGSLLHTVKNDLSTTRARIVALCQDALQPAIDDGRISNVVIVAERVGSGRYTLEVHWRARSGRAGHVRLPIGF